MSRLMTLAVAVGLEAQVNELDRYHSEAMPGLHRFAAGQKVEMGDSEKFCQFLAKCLPQDKAKGPGSLCLQRNRGLS